MASLSLKIIYCTFAPLPNRIPFIAICALLWRKKKLIWLLGILCFGKTVGCIQWTQTQREMQYLGRLKKWQLVQHCYAGAAELVGPFPLVMLYDSTIHRECLCPREFPRYRLLWAGWGAQWENLAFSQCPILYHLSLVWPSWPGWKSSYEKQQVFLNSDLTPCLPTAEPLSLPGCLPEGLRGLCAPGLHPLSH